LLSAAFVLLAWRARTRLVLVPLAAVYFQLAVQTEIVTAPQSKLEWGLSSVALGFALLLGSLLGSWRSLRARSSRRTAD
jgi:hypothetical protein